MNHNERWLTYFMKLCEVTAQMSKDPSTKVGAAIVRPDKTVASLGYNGFARGCEDGPEMYADRDTKYSRVVHAETNCILHAHEPVRGYTLYVWPFPPCDRCAATIIQAGIACVVAPPLPEDAAPRWAEAVARAERMFEEAGVKVECFEREVVS